jgi:5-methylcytosine-specific restriction enzyme A
MGRIRLIGQRIKPLNVARAAVPPKTADSFYQSPAWREFSATVKAERGNRCEEAGCGYHGPRLIADHIIEVKDGGALLDRRNILIRCTPCHNRKTAQAQRQRALGSLPASKGGLPTKP